MPTTQRLRVSEPGNISRRRPSLGQPAPLSPDWGGVAADLPPHGPGWAGGGVDVDVVALRIGQDRSGEVWIGGRSHGHETSVEPVSWNSSTMEPLSSAA